MCANYNRPSVLDAIRLSASGIDIKSSMCADLIVAPNNFYYQKTASAQWQSDLWRLVCPVQQQAPNIANDQGADPQLKAALAHRLIMRGVSHLIEDTDRKFLSMIYNAITRGDLEVLLQVLKLISESIPHKLNAYVTTLDKRLSEIASGVCLTWQSRDMILLHVYHGDCAVAINPRTGQTAVLRIFTDWDGSVFVGNAEFLSRETQPVLDMIKAQLIRRVLLDYDPESYDSVIQMPVGMELAA